MEFRRVLFRSTNNVFMSLSSSGASNTSGLNHQKAFISGNPIPFDITRSGRSMTIASNTLNISLGESANAAFNIQVVYNIARSNTTSIKKAINKTVYVKIDCSNNAATTKGPWSLGLPDGYKINGVYLDTSGSKSYSNSGINYISDFTLDTGQRDSHYSLSYLKPLTSSILNRINSDTVMLVSMQCFTFDTSQGKGFFDAKIGRAHV